ncbi:response regulator [Chlorogloeopsis sp. ULAP01]|uniref:response regulator n=1 Tax=Chlorogloeopsis sp. ULAP01 TaxID=3056483 RepID=UPI0025AA96BE|nr:response regulator [Chlorogloeopsis sp. ULAP01]MDM9385804.1 response regulator [Chlorogloeopsis sp. ULAP01]
MSEEEFTQHFQIIRQQIEALQKYIDLTPTQQQQVAEAMEEIVASLGNLQLFQEETQASLEAMEDIQDELLQQNEYLAVECQHYYELFNFAPDAYLLTDAQGMIQKANREAGALFNVLPNFLIGKPLVNFVAEVERSLFRTKLNQLSQLDSLQEWEIVICPRGGEPFDAALMVAPIRNTSGLLVSLQISIRDVTKYKQANLQLQAIASQLLPEAAAVETPRSLDGLQVLFVDDEADAREFITTVLEQHGILVTAVNSVAEALEVLEQLHPDVIISDIRMPDEDGYALIRKVKTLEAEKGWQIPTAALTAYLAEDRAKAIKAGFQSHLHKLAEPTELVAMVAQLAGRG